MTALAFDMGDTAPFSINIAIAPAAQGQGLGRRLVEHLLAVARAQCYARLVLGTGNSSIGNFAFYQRLGFRMTEIWPDYFPAAGYPPIEENGIPCRDMVRFCRDLG